ncbi:ATP-dependent helicase [Clostridium sp. ZBS12]|uniref:ATP-dependent helicase n=1 Tax=Clostridium sp. ZBS12 TaxID=2949972 RepID=UPI002079BCF5|nr:ATP-dependent helicase [Clostridium sp. ZBS12]
MSYYEEKLKQILADEYQKEAYLSNKSTVVLAGPGSGKTTVLTLKMKRLLDRYISNYRGLACMTFSKEAAREFTDRLGKFGLVKNSSIFLGTVHSFCLKEIILPFGELYNSKIPFPIEIITKNEKRNIISRIKRELEDELTIELSNVSVTTVYALRTLDINGVSKVRYEIDDNVKIIANRYEDYLEKIKKVDYVSLIKYSMELVQNNEYIRKCLEARFPWILVDEYQDLGRPIHEMILCLMNNTKIKFFVVGDADQSIYSFQGAKPDYLLELSSIDNINSIILKNNYRSKKEIIEGSALVLDINRNYVAKNSLGESAQYFFYNCIWGLDEQYTVIAQNIIPKCLSQGVKMHEIGILVPNNEEANRLGEILDSYNISHYISKHIYERTDFIIWLEKIAKWLNDDCTISFDELFEYWNKKIINNLDIINSEVYNRKNLYSIFKKSIECKYNLSEWLEYLVSKLDIKGVFKQEKEISEIENLDQLIGESTNGNLAEWTINDFSVESEPINQVIISTRHSSKGLEFEVVILVGLDDGNFPKYAVYNTNINENIRKTIMEEERRICFVCISRAKKECHLLNSKKGWVVNRRYPDGRWFNKQPSIFFRKLYSKFGAKHNTFDINLD